MERQTSRRLKAISYSDGIATSGVCENCGRLFRADIESAPNIFHAIRNFLVEFENHDCMLESSRPPSFDRVGS